MDPHQHAEGFFADMDVANGGELRQQAPAGWGQSLKAAGEEGGRPRRAGHDVVARPRLQAVYDDATGPAGQAGSSRRRPDR